MNIPARLTTDERMSFLKENREDIITAILCRGQKDFKKLFMNTIIELVTDKAFYIDRSNNPDEEIDFENLMDEASQIVTEKTFGYNDVEDKSSEFEMIEMNREGARNQRGSSMR